MSIIGCILGLLLAGYLLILLLMYQFQSRMIYHPAKGLWTEPSAAGLAFEDVIFDTEDDRQLHGWFIPSDDMSATVLYFHGNAGNISGRLETIGLLHSLGLNVFIFDYRGYGKSEGSPSEKGTYRDASAAWNYLTQSRAINAGKIVVMGRSLGGSIAAWLGSRKNPAALIIESTFTSAADLGAGLYPWLPVRMLIKYDYCTAEYISKVKAPVFMAHSRDDRVVPFHHGERLFELAQEPKTFVELQGGHASGFLETPGYRPKLQAFLKAYVD
ncbi:MAG TPA: alpha/beta hydrolase [Fodinibius sp.]|nr:alpha/beta hydrolase [Fodinibius sp.]